MDVMLHIPAGSLQISLLDLAGHSLAGPEPLDAALFAAGGKLHQATVRQFLMATLQNDPRFVGLGRAMQAALIPPEIDKALVQHKPERIYLAIEHPDLRDLPWEMLQSEASAFAEFLHIDKSCLRAPGKELEAAVAVPPCPLRMLIVCAFDPTDPAAEKGYEEIAGIQEVLRGSCHLVVCEVLHTAKQFLLKDGTRKVVDLTRRPGDRPVPARSAAYDLVALTTQIETARPHILHFIGHSVNGALSIFLRGESKDGYVPWDTARIRAFLGKVPDLRLAYLNSCRSGGSAEQAAALFPASLSQTFMSQALAVVAMQSDVSGESARVAAATFYETLLKGHDAALALNQARDKLFQKYSGENRETYLPVLVSRSAIEQVVRLTPAAEPAVVKAWNQFLDKPEAIREHFVNQHAPRRSLYESILSGKSKVIAVNGKADTGKSWLLKQAMHALALQGWHGRYLKAPGSCDWLQLAREIVRTGGVLQPALSRKDQFIEELNRLSKALGYVPGSTEDVAGSLPEIQARRPSNTFSAEVLRELRQTLAAERTGHPYVLIVDQWETVEASNREILRQDFLQLPGDDLVVVLGWRHQESETPDFTWTDIPMGELSLDEVKEIGPDLISNMYPGRNLTKAFRWVTELEDPPTWTVKELNEFCTGTYRAIPRT